MKTIFNSADRRVQSAYTNIYRESVIKWSHTGPDIRCRPGSIVFVAEKHTGPRCKPRPDQNTPEITQIKPESVTSTITGNSYM